MKEKLGNENESKLLRQKKEKKKANNVESVKGITRQDEIM
jgi:hypothetical protein